MAQTERVQARGGRCLGKCDGASGTAVRCDEDANSSRPMAVHALHDSSPPWLSWNPALWLGRSVMPGAALRGLLVLRLSFPEQGGEKRSAACAVKLGQPRWVNHRPAAVSEALCLIVCRIMLCCVVNSVEGERGKVRCLVHSQCWSLSRTGQDISRQLSRQEVSVVEKRRTACAQAPKASTSP